MILRWFTSPRFAAAPEDEGGGGASAEVDEVETDEEPDEAEAEEEKPEKPAKPAKAEKPAKGEKDAKTEKGKKGDATKPAPKKTLLGQSEKPDASDADAKGKGKDGKPDAAESELAGWKPKLPEGVKVDEELLGQLRTWGSKRGLQGDALQEAVELGVKLQQKATAAFVGAHETMVDGWAKQARADKEIGGAKLEESLQAGLSALRRHAGADFPSLVSELDRTGLGSHPAVIRLLAKIDKLTREDDTGSRVRGGKSGARSADPMDRFAKGMYPKMQRELARERGEDVDDVDG
jgi:hypothetical protein